MEIFWIHQRHRCIYERESYYTISLDTYIRASDLYYGHSGSCVYKLLSFPGCDKDALLGQGIFWKKGKLDFFSMRLIQSL